MPPFQSWLYRWVPLVHKYPTQASRSWVEVLISTPYSRVNVPFMKWYRHRPSSMCQVYTAVYSVFLAHFSNSFHVKSHWSQVVNHAKPNYGDLVFVVLYSFYHLLGGCFSTELIHRHWYHAVLNWLPFDFDPRLNSIEIWREFVLNSHYFIPLSLWLIQSSQNLMNVFC